MNTLHKSISIYEYFLSNGNRLESKNDFECNIFEYYYVIISLYDYIYNI